MQLALSGLTALRVWRAIRTGKLPGVRVGARVDLPAPDPAPANRWTQKAFDLAFLGIDEPLDQKHPLYIAVPDAKLRIRTRGTVCSVFTRIPAGSFVDVGHGVAIACPELVFAEMSAAMSRPVQLLLGYELCGGYSRDSDDPRDGKVTYSVDPLTTPEAIGEYLEGCRHMPRIWQSREALPYLLGNAWSPIEAIIAQMIVLDPCESGYDSARSSSIAASALQRRAPACRISSLPARTWASTTTAGSTSGSRTSSQRQAPRASARRSPRPGPKSWETSGATGNFLPMDTRCCPSRARTSTSPAASTS